MLRVLLVLSAVFVLSYMQQGDAQTEKASNISSLYSEYEKNPTSKRRKSLLKALTDYSGPPTTDSVKSHLTIMANDSKQADYRKLKESAMLAATHLEPLADLLPQQYAEAQYLSAIGAFNHTQDSSALITMAHAQGFAYSAKTESGETPEWAENLRFRAEAWRLAMDAYFVSANKEAPSRAEQSAILATYGADFDSINSRADETSASNGRLRHCKGGLAQKPKMKFPKRNARKGMFGSVILEYEFDANGRVVNPVVLAAVPESGFDEQVISTVTQWQYNVFSDEQPGVNCRIKRKNILQSFVFELE